uniref:LamG-like jellyroll fold domain-containing protein n=1 Tax=viral metagenome TaxID=1070528 RepID=A0A6C0E8F3_9ZZZZ
MTANQVNGYFNTLNVTNTNGRIKLDVDGNLRLVSRRLFLSCSGAIQLNTDSSSYWTCSSGNLKMDAETGKIIINAGNNASDAIQITSSNASGGILVSSGTHGTMLTSTGDITLKSVGNDLKFGVPDENYDALNPDNQTVNIEMEATNYISMNSQDFQVTTTESINLISQSGDFNIGTSSVAPFFKMIDGALLLDSTETTALRKLLIDCDDSSIQKPDYNGILVRSLSNDVSADLTLQTTTGSTSLISIGVESSDSIHAIHEKYLAFKTSNKIIAYEGPREFNSSDIGKTFYWTTSEASETIIGTGSYITEASTNSVNNSLTLTTGGTYTGLGRKYYKIVVDYVESTPNRFKWSNDAGLTFQEEQIDMTGSPITLEYGINITFSATTGHTLGSYWSFTVMPAAIVSTSGSRSMQMGHTLISGVTYLTNEKERDFQIKTSNQERIRVTDNGQVGIGTGQPVSTLEVKNKVGERIFLSTRFSDNQIDPSVAGLVNGGWVAVWESYTSAEYDIYCQIFNSDGSRNGSEFRVNSASFSNQSYPHVAANINKTYGGFIVVWSSRDSGTYNIRGQIFDETAEDGSRALNSFDLEINATTLYNQKYPRATGLEDGNYVVVWSSNHEDSGTNTDVYFQRVSRTGNLTGGETKVNTTTANTQTYPYITSISNNDQTIPGGFVIGYMSEYSPQSNVYDIMYQQYDSSADPNGSEVIITDGSPKTYGRLAMTGIFEGGFVITYNQAYYGDSSKLIYIDGGDQDALTGLTSGAGGTLSGTNVNHPTIIKVTVNSGVFLDGEDFTTSLSGRTEKIESISNTSDIYVLDSGDIEITLSRDIKVIKASKYSTSSSTPIYTIESVNTTPIKDDEELQNANPDEWNREHTYLTSQFPLPTISGTNDNNFMIAWTSGKIPSIYYQKFDALTGVKIGSEVQIQKSGRELKQRNPFLSKIVNKSGQDCGLVLVYDAETYDTFKQGVFAELINDDNPLIKFSNGLTSYTFMNDTKVGFGTSNPDAALHIMNTEPYITLQNSMDELGDGLGESRIYFKDKYSNILAEIKGSYSSSYETRDPVSNSLKLWYTFDHLDGTTSTIDYSQSHIDATLHNFDLNRCWVKGKVRNALEFDGINSYLDCGDSSIITDIGNSNFTISTWLKIYSNGSIGRNSTIVSNSNGLSTGFYNLSLNSGSVAVGTLYTSNGAQSVTGSTDIADGSWHHLVYTVDETKSKIFIDGVIDSSANLTGTKGSPSGTPNVYLGTLDKSSNFLLGYLDDFRIYNTNLNVDNVLELYQNINLNKGKLILKTNNGTGIETNDNIRGLVLNSDGYLEGFKLKGTPNTSLTGTLTPDGTDVTGSNSELLSEVSIGDTILLNAERRIVTKVVSDTSLIVSEAFIGTSGDSTTERIPALFTVIDTSSNLNLLMDSDGNMGIGKENPEGRLHIAGDGSVRNMPYIYLTNTMAENTSGGRETRIIFKGYRSSSHHILGQIEVSHEGNGNDKKARMKFNVNNGTSLTSGLILNSSGYLGIGYNFDPSAQLEIKAKNNSEATILLKSGSNDEAILGGASNIQFQAIGVGRPYAQITGSSDSLGDGPEGRLDFYTNDGSNNITRMVMKNNAGISFYLPEPVNRFHISPLLSDPPDGQTIALSGTTITGVGTAFTASIIGSIIYFKTSRASRVITAVGGTTSLTVSESGNYPAQDYAIYYAGININSNGNVGINTARQHSNLHIGGSIATGLKTINYSDTSSGDYTLTSSYNTLLVNTNNSNGITLNLPPASSVTGRIYNIKKTANNLYDLIINPNGSEKIDADTQITITTNYKYAQIQSDGANWYIISDNL